MATWWKAMPQGYSAGPPPGGAPVACEPISFQALREEDFAADPMTQYRHWYAEAQARMGAAADALVVATADERGVPSARIVLLRGVGDAGLTFFTNYESAKGRDLAENPRVALLSHWHDLDRQVRVKGRA